MSASNPDDVSAAFQEEETVPSSTELRRIMDMIFPSFDPSANGVPPFPAISMIIPFLSFRIILRALFEREILLVT